MVTTPNYNLDIDTTLGGDNASDYIIPSQKAIKEYIDNHANSVFVASYGETEYNDVYDALSEGKIVFYEAFGGPEIDNTVGCLSYFNEDNEEFIFDATLSDSYTSGSYTYIQASLQRYSGWSSITTELQPKLVSGTNIKTINNQSLLGSGNIDIQGGSTVTVDDALSTTSTNPVQNKVITNALDNKADDNAVIKKDGDSAQQTISLSSGTGTTALGVKSRATTSYISFSSSSKWLGSFGVNANQKPTFYNGTGYTLATLDDIPDISGKQDTLVSGTNIKTINNESLLGSGNINISEVTESTVSGWGFTKNTGTVTSVNNVQPVGGNITLSIPADTADLTNSAGFITSSALNGYATETWVGEQGFLTSVPDATTSSKGLVQPDGTTITINNGVISANASTPSNMVTTNTTQTITSKKTFSNSSNTPLVIERKRSNSSNDTYFAINTGSSGSTNVFQVMADVNNLNNCTKTRFNIGNSNTSKLEVGLGTGSGNDYGLLTIGRNSLTYTTSGGVTKDLLANSATAWGGITGTLSDQTDLQTALDGKQDTLVSGTNIKTINNQSILGSGNIDIQGGADNVFIAEYGVTTFTEALIAYSENKQLLFYKNAYGSGDGNKIYSLNYVYSMDTEAGTTPYFKFFVTNKDTVDKYILTSSGWSSSTTTIGTVTSVNNISPVNGNVTLNIPDNVFIAEWDETTYTEVETAWNSGKSIVCHYDSGSDASMLPLIGYTGATFLFGGIFENNSYSLLLTNNDTWTALDTIELQPKQFSVTTNTQQTITAKKTFSNSSNIPLVIERKRLASSNDAYFNINTGSSGSSNVLTVVADVDNMNTCTKTRINIGNANTSKLEVGLGTGTGNDYGLLKLGNNSLTYTKSNNTTIDLLAIPTLYTTTGQNTDGTMTQKSITDELYYSVGDSVTSYKVGAWGHLTSSKTNMIFSVPLDKRVPSGATIDITSLAAQIRGAGGTITISSLSVLDYVAVNADYSHGSIVLIYLHSSSLFASATNNECYEALLTFDFEIVNSTP